MRRVRRESANQESVTDPDSVHSLISRTTVFLFVFCGCVSFSLCDGLSFASVALRVAGLTGVHVYFSPTFPPDRPTSLRYNRCHISDAIRSFAIDARVPIRRIG